MPRPPIFWADDMSGPNGADLREPRKKFMCRRLTGPPRTLGRGERFNGHMAVKWLRQPCGFDRP